MELLEAEKEFSLRLYRWALAEAIHEAEQGYPLLKSLGLGLSVGYTHIVEVLSPEARLDLAALFVNRAHPKAAQAEGQALTEEDRKRGQKYLDLIGHHLAKGTGGRLRRGQIDYSYTPLKRKWIASLVRRKLAEGLDKSALGKRQPESTVELDYHRQIDAWHLGTWVGTGPQGFTCEHQLFRTDDSFETLAASTYRGGGNFSYAFLLGLGLTGWEAFSEEEANIAADSLVRVCSRVLSEIPPLLEGL